MRLFLLIFLCRCVLQSFAQIENSEWRIANAVDLPSYWVVIEVEFHITSSCDSRVTEIPMASGYQAFSSTGAHPPSYAADGAAMNGWAESWWSQCIDSCAVGEAWVGQRFTAISPVVKCIRLWQIPHVNHSASMVRLDRWNGNAWETVQTFSEVGAGFFEILPIEQHAQWRIVPNEVLGSFAWAVAEMSMFAAIECHVEALGRRSAYGELNGTSPWDLANPVTNLGDANEATHWIAPCSNGTCMVLDGGISFAVWPWVSFSLREPGEVRCIKLLQVNGMGLHSVMVQAWTGSNYSNATVFSYLAPGYWDHLYRWEACTHVENSLFRVLPDEFITGHWTVYELEFHRSINCSDPMPQVFGMVSGLSNETSLRAAGFDSNASMASLASFDSNVSTFWRSGAARGSSGRQWSGWYAGNNPKYAEAKFNNGTFNNATEPVTSNNGTRSVTYHALGVPWLGISVTQDIKGPRCLKFLQSGEIGPPADSTSTLVVQNWNGSAWQDYTAHILAAGTVNLWYSELTSVPLSRGPNFFMRLPCLDRTQWRLTAHDIMWEYWAIKELQFFEAIDCRYEVKGAPIAAGEEPFTTEHPASNAFDGELTTEAWSTCSQCYPKQAWLGVALPQPRNVRCIGVVQSSQPPRDRPVPWWTVAASVDRWNGHRWVEVAQGLGMEWGVWNRLHVFTLPYFPDDAVSGDPYYTTAENSIWRVIQNDEVSLRWQVPSVYFYKDFDCSDADAIDNDHGITNGHVIGNGMPMAFDNTTETAWLSACEQCSARQAWLGVNLATSRWLHCVGIYQGVTESAGSRSVGVERWNGQYWQVAESRSSMVLGTWEFMRMIDGGAAGNSDNRARWRLTNAAPIAQSWMIGGLKFFTTPNCSNVASGIHISSGYKNKFSHDNAFDDNLDTYWQSSCQGCVIEQAWLGLSLEEGYPALRCAQIWQPIEFDYATSEASMQVWGGASWTNVAQFQALNFWAWSHLHLIVPPVMVNSLWPETPLVAENTMWRIVNAEEIERIWVVRQLKFFRNAQYSNCSGRINGIPIASGQAFGYPPEKAFQDSVAASAQVYGSQTAAKEWHSPCLGCASGVAWIGLSLKEAREIQCIEFEQSDLQRDSTSSLALERWDGTAWKVVQLYHGVSSGSPLRLSASWVHPAAYQRFRVVNLNPIQGPWQIRELKFYNDVECTVEVSGMPISSGHSETDVPALAFDDDVASYWSSSAAPVAARNASLGLHFDSPNDVKCIAIRQVDDIGKWAQGVEVQRSGLESFGGWFFVYQLTSLNIGAWFVIHPFTAAWRGLYVNFQPEESDVPDGYVADYGDTYSVQESGLSHGWTCLLKGVKRDLLPDLIRDTLVPLNCPNPVWEADIILGRYYVTVTYSDPGVGGETSGCYLEGLSAAAGPIPQLEATTRKLVVDIFDGRLTFAGSNQNQCDSIAAIQADPLPEGFSMWRLTNGAEVQGHWRINELEMHATSLCSLDIFGLRDKLLVTSGWVAGSESDKSIDGDIATSWASGCFGCKPAEAWLAVSFNTFQMVKCLRIYQSAEEDSQSSSIIVQIWNRSAWETYEMYSDTPGGIWGTYNERWVHPASGYRWRLTNSQPLIESLRIAEAEFFSDVGCTQRLAGFPLASDISPSSPAFRAFDGDYKTEWLSTCSSCNVSEAWLGVHFKQSQVVLCASAALSESQSGAVQLRLEEWNGTHWAGFGPTMTARANSWGHAHRIEAVPALQPGALWRLRNVLPTTAPWRILEIEFHIQASCDDKVTGTPLASSETAPGTFGPDLAFDGSADYFSSWVAGCNAANGCPAMSEWIGVLFPQSYLFQCLRIYQPAPSLGGNPAADSIAMERWIGTEWELVRTFGTVRSGGWDNLPVLEGSQKFSTGSREWRIMSDRALTKHWSIMEVTFYSSIECTDKVVGTVSASAVAGSQFVSLAIDGRTDTSWWSQSQPGSKEAWFAITFGSATVVKCVRLLQNPDDGYHSDGVHLESRFGQDWLHILTFTQVSAGRFRNLHIFPAVTDKPNGAMWRVLNYDSISDGWVIIELEFYSDQDCSRIEIGTHMASGYSLEEPVAAAFDTALNTHWRSSCQSCDRGHAWLGQSFFQFSSGSSSNAPQPRAIDVQCVVIMQGSGLNNASSEITVETWTGTTWLRRGKFENVPGDDFVQLRLGISGNASVVVDSQRKELMLQATPDPGDLTALRQHLDIYNDRVRSSIRMQVNEWPMQLTNSRQDTDAFIESWTRAVRSSIAARVDLPLTYVFVDGPLLNVKDDTTVKASITGTVDAFVPKDSQSIINTSSGNARRRLFQTDSEVVMDWFEGVSIDPVGVEALFFVDTLKTSLRSATRLDPLQASVVTQVEPSIQVILGFPQLIVSTATTPAPPEQGIQETPQEEEDKTVIWILMLVSIVVGALIVKKIVDCYWFQRKLYQEKELWVVTHPGEPFPERLRESCCSLAFCCGFKRKQKGAIASKQEIMDREVNEKDKAAAHEFRQIGDVQTADALDPRGAEGLEALESLERFQSEERRKSAFMGGADERRLSRLSSRVSHKEKGKTVSQNAALALGLDPEALVKRRSSTRLSQNTLRTSQASTKHSEVGSEIVPASERRSNSARISFDENNDDT